MLLEKTINFEKNAFKFFPIQYLGLLAPHGHEWR